MTRRRPVPKAWREEHHQLRTWVSHRTGWGWHRTVRVKGRCSCGVRFPASEHTDNLTGPDVREAWNDHVETAYYQDDGEVVA